MADDIDLQALLNGDLDLVNRDLREANLAGLDLSNKDFSGAHLQGANVAGANFEFSKFNQTQTERMNAEGAKFINSTSRSSIWSGVNLKGADMRGSDFASSYFGAGTNLTGADLRGADFRKAHFVESIILDGCIVDEQTKFDGANVFRPLARLEAFRFYRVERGVLVRRTDHEVLDSSSDMELLSLKAQITNSVDALINKISNLTPKIEENYASMGHNNPPEEFPLELEKFNETLATLKDVRAEVQKQKPSSTNIETAISVLSAAAKSILKWTGGKIDIALEEFVKNAGKTLSSKTVVVGGLALSYEFGDLISLLKTFLGMLAP